MNRADTEAQPLVPPIRLKYLRSAKTRVVDSEVSSSLPLQVLIYYNWYYSLLMFVIIIGTNSYKQITIKSSYSFIHFIFLVVWGASEWIRLYYGFIGNIRENFPELMAFMVMTVVFAAPLIAYQFIAIQVRFPVDEVVAILQIIFMAVELVLGIAAVRKLVRNQTAIFFLRNSKPDVYYRVSST